MNKKDDSLLKTLFKGVKKFKKKTTNFSDSSNSINSKDMISELGSFEDMKSPNKSTLHWALVRDVLKKNLNSAKLLEDSKNFEINTLLQNNYHKFINVSKEVEDYLVETIELQESLNKLQKVIDNSSRIVKSLKSNLVDNDDSDDTIHSRVSEEALVASLNNEYFLMKRKLKPNSFTGKTTHLEKSIEENDFRKANAIFEALRNSQITNNIGKLMETSTPGV